MVAVSFFRRGARTLHIFRLLFSHFFETLWCHGPVFYFILHCLRIELIGLFIFSMLLLIIVSLLACVTANISWGRVLAMRYLIALHSFKCIYILPIHLLYLYFTYSFTVFYLLFFLSNVAARARLPRIRDSLCVGVSLRVNVCPCHVIVFYLASWCAGQVLVSRCVASVAWGFTSYRVLESYPCSKFPLYFLVIVILYNVPVVWLGYSLRCARPKLPLPSLSCLCV